MVAEQWTHLLQQEFASQGEMENQVGMETTLFGGPPEIGNVMKLANGQIGFMGIFAHPLFANVADVIPAMGFAATEIMKNKGVWITRIEHEKRIEQLRNEGGFSDGGISPRSHSPVLRNLAILQTGHSPSTGYIPATPLRHASNPPSPLQQHIQGSHDSSVASMSHMMRTDDPPKNKSDVPPWRSPLVSNGATATSNMTSAPHEFTPSSSGVFPSAKSQLEAQRPEVQTRRSSNAVPRSLQVNGVSEPHGESNTTTTNTSTASSEHGGDRERRVSELRKSNYTSASVPLVYDDLVPDLPSQQLFPDQGGSITERSPNQGPQVPLSKYCAVPTRTSSQGQNQGRNSGRMSVPSTTDGNSMVTSGGQTYSTYLSTTLLPSTEATSFLSAESSDEQLKDRRNGRKNPTTRRKTDRDRAKSSPSLLPEVAPSNTSTGASPAVHSGGGGTKNPTKTSTAMVQEPGQATWSAWEEGDGERSMRKRMSRFKFWRRKTDEDG